MNLLPFELQPPYRTRQFVPDKVDLGDWNQVSPLFDKLEKSAASARTPAELERWLRDGGELSAALDEESSRRYIAMTCHTDNAEAEKAYLHFVEEIEPRTKPRQFNLAELFLKHPARADLPKDRYFIFDRSTKAQA